MLLLTQQFVIRAMSTYEIELHTCTVVMFECPVGLVKCGYKCSCLYFGSLEGGLFECCCWAVGCVQLCLKFFVLVFDQ